MSMPSPPQLCFPQASSDGFLIPVAELTPDSPWPGTKSDHRPSCQLAAGGGWDGGGPAEGSSPKSQGPGRGREGAGGASSSASLRPHSREATSAGWTLCGDRAVSWATRPTRPQGLLPDPALNPKLCTKQVPHRLHGHTYHIFTDNINMTLSIKHL